MSDAKITALEAMRHMRAIAARLGDAAAAYAEIMTDGERPAVTPGHFYATFDGSLAYIARRQGKCRCPACSGGGPMGMIAAALGLPTAPAAEPEPGDHAAPEFRAIVIHGGHGLAEYDGAGPGDSYRVNSEGWTMHAGQEDFASRVSIAMAGLSLRRRVELRLVEAEAAVLPG